MPNSLSAIFSAIVYNTETIFSKAFVVGNLWCHFEYMSNNNIIGLRPLIREGRYVGYDYVYEELLKKDLKYDTKPLTENKTDLEIGLYDMNDCQTVFFGAKDFDDDIQPAQKNNKH